MRELSNIAYTHGGKFHADDVFSAALLQILHPGIEIRRMFSPPEDGSAFVFDIGCGEFDHHQSSAEVRPNGVPYAAFGLLWREFGASLIGEDEVERFDESFVQPLDLDDNTGCGSEIAACISAFNPSWDSDDQPDDRFARAVAFAREIIELRLEQSRSYARGRSLVEQALAEATENIVVLPQFAPWKSVLPKSDAEFVIYPSQRGGYSAQAVPSGDAEHPLKIPFPAEWAGLPNRELAKISGIPTLRFCHNSGFLIATDTLKDAREACRLAARLKPE